MTTLGQTYDYDSVMQYSAVAFSKSNHYTILPINADPNRMGQRFKFSEIDIRKINRAYECSENELNAIIEDPVEQIRSRSGLVIGLPGVCHDRLPITAAMVHNGFTYLFKGY